MPTPSARLGIPNYTEDDTPVDLPTAWLARSVVLDTLVPISSGTLAQRPTSSPSTLGIVGRQAIVTGEVDSPRLDLDLGSSWVTVGPPTKDGDPAVAGSRSLGTGVGQAAPGNSASFFSPGDLKVSAAANPQTGWLRCDGAAVSRTTYAALYAAISTAYGTGDGSTTFNVPDYRGRTIVGAGAGPGLTNRPIGYKDGEENHSLATAEMPSHNHGGATGGGTTGGGTTGAVQSGGRSNGHTHPSLSNGYALVASAASVALASWAPQAGHTPCIMTNGPIASGGTGGEDADHSHYVPGMSVPGLSVPALGITAQGGGGVHNNMQPYAVANVFIKT
jgi:microcystin-dependent protein